MSASGRPEAGWSLGPGLMAGVLVAVILLGAGLLLSRVEVALLAAPIALSCAWAWDRRPRRAEAGTVLTAELDPRPQDGTIGYRLDFPDDGVEQVRIRLIALRRQSAEVVVRARGPLTGRIPIPHSGPQEVLYLDYCALTADGGFFTETLDPIVLERVIVPTIRPLQSLPLPGYLPGLTGNHNATRPGDGGEFRDIHEFAPGDKLKRIDWKVTLRRAQRPGELYVRRSSALADATVLLVVDSRDDVGENVASWSGDRRVFEGRSSMDYAREAATSLAAAYIRGGDRVGLRDLATDARMVAHGGGTRHLERLQRAIALAHPSGAPQRRERAPLVTPGALIYILSTFLDEEAGRMAQAWRAGGHRVVAVDVLPAPRTHGLGTELGVAFRMVMAERADRIRSLTAQGVEVLRWQQDDPDDSVAARLRTMSRPVRSRA